MVLSDKKLFDDIYKYLFDKLNTELPTLMSQDNNINTESFNMFKNLSVSLLIFTSVVTADPDIKPDSTLSTQLNQTVLAIINLYTNLKSEDNSAREVLYYCYYLCASYYNNIICDNDVIDEVIIIFNKNLISYIELAKNKKTRNSIINELYSMLNAVYIIIIIRNTLIRLHPEILESKLLGTIFAIYKQYLNIYQILSSGKITETISYNHLLREILLLTDSLPDKLLIDLFSQIYPIIKYCLTNGSSLSNDYINDYISCDVNLISYEYSKYNEKIWNISSYIDNNYNRINSFTDVISGITYNREMIYKNIDKLPNKEFRFKPVKSLSEMLTISSVYTLGIRLPKLHVEQCIEYYKELIDLMSGLRVSNADKSRYEIDIDLISYICILNIII